MEKGTALPKNIRQIGEIQGKEKVCIEDYVMTYIHKKEPQEEKGFLGVFLGERRETEEGTYVFIRGILEMSFEDCQKKTTEQARQEKQKEEEIRAEEENVQDTKIRAKEEHGKENEIAERKEAGIEEKKNRFEKVGMVTHDGKEEGIQQETQEMPRGSREWFEKQKAEYFPGWEIQGCCVIGMYQPKQLEQLAEIAPEAGQIIYHLQEQEETLYWRDAEEYRRLRGYLVFYEQNRNMQEYMAEEFKDKSVEKESLPDQAIRSFREKIREKGEKRTGSMLRLASSFFVVTVLIVGAIAVNRIDDIRMGRNALKNDQEAVSGQIQQEGERFSPANSGTDGSSTATSGNVLGQPGTGADAAGDILNVTDSIQNTAAGMQGLADNMQNSAAGTQGVGDNMQNSAAGTQGVSDNMQNSAAGTQGVGDNMQNSAAGTQGVSDNIQNLAAGTQGVGDNMQNSAAGTQGVGDNMQNSAAGMQGVGDNMQNSAAGTQGVGDNMQNSAAGTQGVSDNMQNSAAGMQDAAGNMANQAGNMQDSAAVMQNSDAAQSGGQNSSGNGTAQSSDGTAGLQGSGNLADAAGGQDVSGAQSSEGARDTSGGSASGTNSSPVESGASGTAGTQSSTADGTSDSPAASETSARAIHASYVIRQGDTLADICSRYYGSMDRVEEICSVNHIADANMIMPGQKIVLP